MSLSDWKANVGRAREMKDAFLAQNWKSPIPPQDRPRFKGLQYYPPDSSYRFELEFHEHPEQQVIRMAYTKGNEQDFIRWGEFRFKLDEKQCVIQAYRSNPEEERLWIPFRDKTSGKETYGAGRYIDLETEKHLTTDGKWILDFNKAYNPWCAYSEEYVCPFIPPENWLEIPIKAGEKKYPLEKTNHVIA